MAGSECDRDVCGGGSMRGWGMRGMRGVRAGEMATEAGGTHPTGMHSCSTVSAKENISDAKLKLSREGGKISPHISPRHKVLREKFPFWGSEIFCAGHIRSPPSP